MILTNPITGKATRACELLHKALQLKADYQANLIDKSMFDQLRCVLVAKVVCITEMDRLASNNTKKATAKVLTILEDVI